MTPEQAGMARNNADASQYIKDMHRQLFGPAFGEK